MKKTAILICSLWLSLWLAACQAVQGISTSPAIGTGGLAATSSSQWMQLALGTLMLDEKDLPVDAAQAVELLPLWKAARSLNSSDTTAAAEVSGLLKQIQGSLTSEQLKAIQTMDLSPQNLPASIQQLGIQTGFTGQLANGGTPPSSTGNGGGSGGPPGDFGGMPGGPGGGGPPSAQTTQVASGAESTSLGVSTALLEEVIKYLQAKQ
jgi:hypothetical protein